MNTRHMILDDGCSPELIRGAIFDNVIGIPKIVDSKYKIIPAGITPFSKINETTLPNEAIGFYEMDDKFKDIIIHPKNYICTFRKFDATISTDNSQCRNAPPFLQLLNIYRSRAIGSYMQRQGINVIPQIRWGSRITYTTDYFPEKIAFLGIDCHSMVAIGTYGCIETREDKYFFKEGLEAMLETLLPETVLVYGNMPNNIFGDYIKTTNFIHYPDWTTRVHQRNGGH